MAQVPGKAFSAGLLTLGLGISLSLAVVAQPPLPPGPPPAAIKQPTLPTKGDAPPVSKTAEKEKLALDQPLAWMLEARRNYTAVRDYTCTMLKVERVKGVLLDEHNIRFTCKAEPFSVHMKWHSPDRFRGQEVVYVQGRYNGKMRVKPKGFVGNLADFRLVAVNDHRVLENSRHTILEAGIGNLIEQCVASIQAERPFNRTKVSTAEYRFDNRTCIRIEMTRPQKIEPYYCARSVLYLDKDSKLPIRMENYDWPTPANPTGDLLERFSYLGLSFNNNISDDYFIK